LPEIVHALGAIVENAVGFAQGRVDIEARWSAAEVEICVGDDGPGFAPGVINRLGEPYLTERDAGAAGGLGLGFFIAKTLLERTGARIQVKNRGSPRRGAVVRARWPRAAIEAPAL
jgi:two-component system sensor histidine kinase RegB